MHTKRLWLKLAGVIALAVALGWAWGWHYGVHEYRGTLRLYDVMLPGSVGNASLDTGTESYRLDVPRAVATREALEKLDGQRVIVTGKLRTRRDFEMRDRQYKVIFVETLR